MILSPNIIISLTASEDGERHSVLVRLDETKVQNSLHHDLGHVEREGFLCAGARPPRCVQQIPAAAATATAAQGPASIGDFAAIPRRQRRDRRLHARARHRVSAPSGRTGRTGRLLGAAAPDIASCPGVVRAGRGYIGSGSSRRWWRGRQRPCPSTITLRDPG